MPRWNLDRLGQTSNVSFPAIVLVGVAFFGVYCPFFYIDMTIDAPSTVSVGQTFVISGTSYQSAAERVNLHLTDFGDSIAYAVVGTAPPYAFEFSVTVSSTGLSVNGVTVYNGTTSGRTFYFFVVSNSRPYNVSPLAGVSVQG